MIPTNIFGGFTDLTSTVGYGRRIGNGASTGQAGFVDMMAGQLGGQEIPTINSIKTCLRRFPELKYHIGALATFVAYTNQFPWVNKDICGPGGVIVKIEPRLNHDDELIGLVDRALSIIKEAAADPQMALDQAENLGAMPPPVAGIDVNSTARVDAAVVRNLAKRLFEFNDLYRQLYKGAQSLIQFSHCVVDYSEDYTKATFYSLDELVKKKDDKSEKAVWMSKKTNEPLSTRFRMVTDGDEIQDSPMGRVVHYLKVLDTLETAMSVERLSKSNSFVVWKVGVDGLPGEVVPGWLDTYKDRVMNRFQAGTNNGNVIHASLSKSLTASHVFIPDYKDSPTTVDSIRMDYRPLLGDLVYWWSKVFMALGIPPYYAISPQEGGNSLQPSGDVTAFHETLLGSRVRMYQGILEKELRYWLHQFLTKNVDQLNMDRYELSVALPTYVSGGEEARSEYMRRINQFASAYSTLSVSGMPIDPKFAVQLMFPNSDPMEVVDWEVRKIMNPDTSDPYADEQGPGDDETYVNDVLDMMSRGVSAPVAGDTVEPPPEGYIDYAGDRMS